MILGLDHFTFNEICFSVMIASYFLVNLINLSNATPMGSGSAIEGTMAMSSAFEAISSMAPAGVLPGVPSGGASHVVSALAGSSQAAGGAPTATRAAPQPHETLDYGPVNTPDTGCEFGNAIVVNKCSVPVNINTIGGFRLNGDPTAASGPEEQVVYPIAPGETYSEGFRSTWVSPDVNNPQAYNPDTDKLFGQGISIKISWPDKPGNNNVTQFEYALTYNPRAPEPYPLLWYDISLLDCGKPAKHNGTDFSATDADYKSKTDQCPGYQGGLTLKFEPEAGIKNTCPEIDCEGECRDIYNFDRTREHEPTKQCWGEFKGNMILSLCAGSGEGTANTRRGLGKDEDVQSAGSV
ncbi:hypothetical protein J4E89_004669 [Alternaria sp. Ai002NY15]|nr:hypothetical protein J4E89_004669 [Alternaria sp. Ai002NY15]